MFLSQRKCEPYWPEGIHEEKKYAYVTVTTVSVDQFADYTVRVLHAKKEVGGHSLQLKPSETLKHLLLVKSCKTLLYCSMHLKQVGVHCVSYIL